MKAGKKPTVNQREYINNHKLNSENWLVTKDTPVHMEIVSRSNGEVRTFMK